MVLLGGIVHSLAATLLELLVLGGVGQGVRDHLFGQAKVTQACSVDGAGGEGALTHTTAHTHGADQLLLDLEGVLNAAASLQGADAGQGEHAVGNLRVEHVVLLRQDVRRGLGEAGQSPDAFDASSVLLAGGVEARAHLHLSQLVDATRTQTIVGQRLAHLGHVLHAVLTVHLLPLGTDAV